MVLYKIFWPANKSLCISSLYLCKNFFLNFRFFVQKLTKSTPLFFPYFPLNWNNHPSTVFIQLASFLLVGLAAGSWGPTKPGNGCIYRGNWYHDGEVIESNRCGSTECMCRTGPVGGHCQIVHRDIIYPCHSDTTTVKPTPVTRNPTCDRAVYIRDGGCPEYDTLGLWSALVYNLTECEMYCKWDKKCAAIVMEGNTCYHMKTGCTPGGNKHKYKFYIYRRCPQK